MRPVFQEIKRLFGDKDITGAEIGVNIGENAGHVLSYLQNLKTFYLVDSWKANEDYPDQGSQDRCFSIVYEKFGNDPRCKVIKDISVNAVNHIPNASLDFVYIDAEHRYFGIKSDIDAWLPKVKPGGIIGGHDYDYPIKPGVKEAVDETFGEMVNLHDSQNDWWVFV
jgi:hypothetical protein